MSGFRPTVAEERWLALAARYRGAAWVGATATHTAGWKSMSLLSRCLFLVLGLVAASMTYGIVRLLHVPAPLLVTGLLLAATAEWLILSRRLFASGIEEALSVAGVLSVVIYLLTKLNPNSDVAPYLVAGALALTGWRLLNPWFVTVGVIALAYAIGNSTSSHIAVYLFCFAAAAAALYSSALELQRPCHASLLDALVVVMPLAGYAFAIVDRPAALTQATLQAPTLSTLLPLLLLFVFGAAAISAGVRRRVHAPLLAAMGCLVCVAYELRAITGLALHWRLILWGGAALLLAIGLERRLRTPWRDITSRDGGDAAAGLDVLQVAGASTLAAAGQPSEASRAGLQGGGGEFGGGGASGRY